MLGDLDYSDNDFSEFHRPEHYIRHIGIFLPIYVQCSSSRFATILEPLESELAVQVEYDMDEQGQFIAYRAHLFNVIYSSQIKNGWTR